MEPLPQSDAWDAFIDLARTDPEPPLDLAALLIAAQAQPEVNVQHWIARLDATAERIRERFPPGINAHERLVRLSTHVTSELGIRGNTKRYYEPQNSYLNRVIDRGLGIPISIAVVLLELGRRVDVPLRGIGFPGHFLLEHCDAPMGYLDPFDPSQILSTDDCRAMLERLSRGKIELRPEHLEPIPAREILVRMLTNLKLVHSRRREYLNAIRMIDGILALDDERITEYRDRGQFYAKIEFDGQAELDLVHYLDAQPSARDATAVQALLDTVRERLSHYH